MLRIWGRLLILETNTLQNAKETENYVKRKGFMRL